MHRFHLLCFIPCHTKPASDSISHSFSVTHKNFPCDLTLKSVWWDVQWLTLPTLSVQSMSQTTQPHKEKLLTGLQHSCSQQLPTSNVFWSLLTDFQTARILVSACLTSPIFLNCPQIKLACLKSITASGTWHVIWPALVSLSTYQGSHLPQSADSWHTNSRLHFCSALTKLSK